MTPKEKAESLLNKFIVEGCLFANAKKCALIAVEEIIKACTNVSGHTMNKDYWHEIKSELEKLK